MNVHPIYRLPSPDGSPPSPGWWRAVRAFLLDTELSAAGAEAWSDGWATAVEKCGEAIRNVEPPLAQQEEP